MHRFFRASVLHRTSQRRSLVTVAVSAVFACLPLGSVSDAGIIEWVTVGDPGNAADTTGSPNPAGAVAASFRIMKYEFTNQLYTDFLNSVARTDTYSLYNTNMGSYVGGGISRSGSSGSYIYSVRTNMGDKPVNYVSWFDAARVANWLMNGALTSSSTETGAYTLVSGQTTGTAPAVNPGASFYLPTENQWYKAAYYKGGGTNAGYWDYGTQSNTTPTAVTADVTGIGSAGSAGNFANYNRVADWNSLNGNVTTVGTNGNASAYGAFDMSGNVREWNGFLGTTGSSHGLRGGHFGSPTAAPLSSSVWLTGGPTVEDDGTGFRLASAVPEIDPSSFGSALAMAMGSLAMLERRARRVFGRRPTV